MPGCGEDYRCLGPCLYQAAAKIVDAEIDSNLLHDGGVAAAVALAPRIAAGDVEAAHELVKHFCQTTLLSNTTFVKHHFYNPVRK